VLQFLNPALLFGALLFTVPLIIHLLNRQRFKRRDWAAMEFLLAAYRKNRRRLRTENLLLLLLRCLIPIVLALAIARPLLRDVAGIAALGGSAHHVLVFDQSYSTSLQPAGAPSAFRQMKDLGSQLLDRIERRRGQKVTLVLGGLRPSVPVRDDLNVAAAKARLAAIRGPVDAAEDLTAALLEAAEIVEDGPEMETRVYLFTDLQARAFGITGEAAPAEPPTAPEDDADTFRDTLRDAFDRLGKRAEITVVDVGGMAADATPEAADNMQITDLRIGRPHAIARVVTPVVATIRNRGRASRSIEVTLELEGGSPTRQTVNVEAGAEAQVEFPVTFHAPGQQRLRASLEQGDGLAADDERFLVARVRDRIALLLVEGEEDETDPALMASEHLRSILDPTRGEGDHDVTPFAPKVISTTQLLMGRERLDSYDAIVLCDVPRLDETAATALREALQTGTGLWVMFGANADPQSFQLHLHGTGDGPMPLRLGNAIGYQPGGDRSYGSLVVAPDHPVLAGFDQDVYREILQEAPIYRAIAAGVETDGSTSTVLARLRDPDQNPLLVASSWGSGKTLFLMSAITACPDKWNELDWLGISMPLFHEAVNWLTQPASDPFNVLCGVPLSTALEARPADVAVLLPERSGSGKVPVGEDSRALPGGRYTMPRFTTTEFAGIYEVEMRLEIDSGPQSALLAFAVNVDPAEGDLSYLSYASVRSKFGVQRVLRALPTEGNVSLDAASNELGVPFLFLTLLLLLGEAGMARFVSRRR
jgi:hypothetical protein